MEYGDLRRLKGGSTRQARGQRFNGLIADLFKVFGIDARANQYGMGELDVTFTHGGQRFILEAKWEQTKTGTGPIAKLQRRVEQRMAGVHGVFLAMAGFTPSALEEINRGRRLDVLLLDQGHWEAMLSGFMPPQELIDQVTNAASFRGRAYTPVADLLKQTAAVPPITFGATDDVGGPPFDDRTITSGHAEVILSGIESPQVGIATGKDLMVLVTLEDGVLAVDLSRHRACWAAPITGCSRGLLACPDGSIVLARAYGIARYDNGELTVLSSGAATSNTSTLLFHPDGSVWCLDPGSADSPTKLIQTGANLGLERWRDVPYPPGGATGAAWLSATDVVVGGNPDLLVHSAEQPDHRIPLPAGTLADLVAIDNRRVVTVDCDLTLHLTDIPAQQHLALGRLKQLEGPACSLTRSPNGTVLLAGQYPTRDGQTRLAVVVLRLPGQRPTFSAAVMPSGPTVRAEADHAWPNLVPVIAAPAKGGTPSAATVAAVPGQAWPIMPVSPVRPASLAPTLPPPAKDRHTEQNRGYLEGIAVAETLPLYAVERYVAASLDVVRWLQPWRDSWRTIATGQAKPGTPVASWLPVVARYLGSEAAPADVVEGYFTPQPSYLVGFSDGMKDAWVRAVSERLLPSDVPALQHWLNQPLSDSDPNALPLRMRTIHDLRAAAQRTRKIATWMVIGRITLWILVVIFGVLEFGAIGATVTNGWNEPKVASAVVGNLCFAVPFAGLLWLAIFDLRRATRGQRTKPVSDTRPT